MINTNTPIFPETVTRGIAVDGEVQTIAINEVSASETTVTGADAVEVVKEKYPDVLPYIDRITVTDTTTAADILQDIQDMADEEGDDSIDTSTVSLSSVHYGHLFIEDVADLTIQTDTRARVTITADGTPILDCFYVPGLDGLIHLDLRDLVLYYTDIPLPTGEAQHLAPEESGLYLTINVTHDSGATDEYELWVNAFRRDIIGKMSDLDYIEIPEDAHIPMAVYRDNNLNNAPVTVTFVSASRRKKLHEGSIADGDGYLLSADVPVSSIPYRKGEPFYIELEISTENIFEDGAPVGYKTRTVRTPVYRVTGRPAEVYYFLNDYGSYDIIAMTGKLSAAPEFEMENAFRSTSIETVKATKNNKYTQNSGYLSIETVKALSSLLLSRKIYYCVPGHAARRIVIEAPSINLATSQSINTATFSWRYADK